MFVEAPYELTCTMLLIKVVSVRLAGTVVVIPISTFLFSDLDSIVIFLALKPRSVLRFCTLRQKFSKNYSIVPPLLSDTDS